ncbi:MAG: hypothetical protein GY811_02330 [Myxococcales bacterium]|nr:hypothetical protein [Myxococcales bacterium]
MLLVIFSGRRPRHGGVTASAREKPRVARGPDAKMSWTRSDDEENAR